jgi:hypothetical protein
MGICSCTKKIDEGKLYLDFIESLNIKNIRSEDLIKKIKEKYITVSKEEKKLSVLLNDIFPMIDCPDIEFKEFSQKFLMEYFEENKKNFYALCLFCSKDSNFKKSFDEITITNKKEFSDKFSTDKALISKEFLLSILYDYIKYSTIATVPFLDRAYGINDIEKYLKELFDAETRLAILKDLFEEFSKNEEMIDLELFFKSECFIKLTDKAEILKMFEMYNSLKK